MNLKIKVQKEIQVPDGTKVINNSDYVTLAYVEDGLINVYTKRADLFFEEDTILSKTDFIEYNKKEVTSMIEMLNK